MFECYKYIGLLYKFQFHLYGKVVGRCACLISLDVDFRRAIVRLLLFAASFDGAISIRQHAVAFHMEDGRDENMVDAAFREAVRVEVIERSVGGIAEVGLFVRVAQHPFAHKGVIGLMRLVYVEVAGEDGGKVFAFAEFFHLFLYEEGAFHAGFLADVVHVQIEE